jgi:outer membrane receptor protein involved in Fe transport
MRRALLLATAISYLPISGVVYAQDAVAPPTSDVGYGDIVVTAQKRSESLQKVPISVAVVTAEEIDQAGITGVADLKISAPGVEVQNSNGYAYPIIRGVGAKVGAPGVENPIAIYVDGVYYAAAPAALLNFNNIAQVEALKGPQGTLFGRNATGGLIQVMTRDPKPEFGGEVTLSYSNYDTKRGTAYLTTGLGEKLSADIAFAGMTMGRGYGKNFSSGKDVYRVHHDINLRSKWLLDLDEQTKITAIFDYSDSRNNSAGQRILRNAAVPPPFGPAFGGSPWDIDTDTEPNYEYEGGGASLRIDHDFGGASLASITAYRKSSYDGTWDFDYTSTPGRQVIFTQPDRQFSQEVQLLSPSNQKITWVLGAYYFDASSAYEPLQFRYFGASQTPRFPDGSRRVALDIQSRQGTKSIAGFGQATVKISDRLSATAGFRYTSERRTLDAIQNQILSTGEVRVMIPRIDTGDRFKKLTWRLALDYQLNDDTLIYGSYNRGFKSGGFNPTSLLIPPYDPEVLDAYEAGFKSTLLDRRVRFNGAVFFYDYKDVQVQVPSPTGTGIYNGSGAELYGAEAEINLRLVRGFDVRLAYQYLHGRYVDFPLAQIAVLNGAGYYDLRTGDVSGNDTVLSPKSTLSASVNYETEIGSGKLGANISYYYNSGYYHEPDNVLRQNGYSMVNASVRYDTENGMYGQFWGRNLTNRAVANFSGVQNFGGLGAGRIAYAPPRTYGVTVGWKF